MRGIKLRNIEAVLFKQLLDTLKNMQLLLLFFIYPLVAFVMVTAMGSQAETKAFFVAVFATMHCVFTPVVCSSAVLADEKENHTLRMLVLSGVKPVEYLFSIGTFVLCATLLTGSLFSFMGGYSLSQSVMLFLLFLTGSVISILLGMCIGIYAPNAVAANAMGVPISMVFSLLPMLAFFNSKIEAIARYTFSYQIGSAIQKIGTGKSIINLEFGIVIPYLIGLFCLFSVLFHKKKWE